ncbi:MAG TPA: prepilin peptidase [Candidatus Eisenbacteria bacterium]|nr:prepilin peptidase [Candidatus Eisenbacteria bacterium]
MSPGVLVRALAGLFGLVMGSAVTALAHRVPRGASWVRGRSACPACGARLGPRDLVPVLSFALARGRCRHCGARIAWRYPLTELVCGAWAVLLVDRVGLQWGFLPIAAWGFLLVALTWIDLDFQLLPDALTFPGTLLAIGWAATQPGGVHQALLGVLVGSGLLWALAELWVRVRRIEGLGGGDIKLAAMFGAALGWRLALVTLFVAALAGSLWGLALIVARRGSGRTALPFGTLLAPTAMAVFLWGERWVQGYLRLFR